MRRVVSLFLPTWPTDRLRRKLGTSAPPPEVPLVVAGRDGRRRVVTAADRAAGVAGLRPGMPVTQARALVPGLLTHGASPEEDEAALERLALWALKRYSPVVAVARPDGLVIDASGAAHLHGGEEAMLADLVGRLSDAGVAARAAMAATHGAAHALARHRARPTLVVGGEETAGALADLPVAALRLTADLVSALRRLGFDRVGRLAAQPRAPLALRFGPELGRRLDQAYGRSAEPVTVVVPPDPFRVRRVFAEPIGAAETLARCTGGLVEALCAALEAKGQGARRLDLLFHRTDHRIEAIRVGTARPVCDAKRLTRLLRDRLETVDPGFGVERMTLTAVLVEPLGYRPAATALGEAPDPDVAGLVDTLASRVGPERLHRFAAAESDVPERSVRKVAPLAGPTTGRWPARWPRPARLLPTPEPIETLALLPDHPPVHFTWRGVRRRVTRADGPERVFGEWWRGDAEARTVRDYFQVETEAGERFWLFREGDGEDAGTGSQRWFLQGVFG
jgi:protein ImuB